MAGDFLASFEAILGRDHLRGCVFTTASGRHMIMCPRLPEQHVRLGWCRSHRDTCSCLLDTPEQKRATPGQQRTDLDSHCSLMPIRKELEGLHLPSRSNGSVSLVGWSRLLARCRFCVSSGRAGTVITSPRGVQPTACCAKVGSLVKTITTAGNFLGAAGFSALHSSQFILLNDRRMSP